ncbi:MAG: YdcF family protein [Alphaproteobacteria bacterium]|nr:YdcF family protein [Alphaproteobacteria bacterium]
MTYFESIYRFFGWWIINIDLLFIVLMFLGGILLLLKRQKGGKRLLIISCFGLCFLGVIPISLWLFENLENRFPKLEHIPSDAKGIIFLGGNFDQMTTLGRNEIAYNLTAGKFIRFIELEKKHPHLQLVMTGTKLETEAAQKEFTALGIDFHHIHFDDDSKNTKDNAARTADLLKPKPDEKWVLVTSAYHMPRSVGLFRKAGFNVIPYPVDYHTPGKYEMWFFLGLKLSLDGWHASSREWLGMFMNYLMGRSNELYPSPE